MPPPGPSECGYMKPADSRLRISRVLVSVIIVLTCWIYIISPFSPVLMKMGCLNF